MRQENARLSLKLGTMPKKEDSQLGRFMGADRDPATYDDEARLKERLRKLATNTQRREEGAERARELARRVTEQVERNERAINEANKTLDGDNRDS